MPAFTASGGRVIWHAHEPLGITPAQAEALRRMIVHQMVDDGLDGFPTRPCGDLIIEITNAILDAKAQMRENVT